MQHRPQPGTSSTPGPPHPWSGCTDLFRLWISSSVKSKMLARWWLVLQAEVKSLCATKRSSLLTAWHRGAAHTLPRHPLPGATALLPMAWEVSSAWNISQSERQELSLPVRAGKTCGEPPGLGSPTQLPNPRLAAQGRGRRTHAGNGIFQQELGPLAPRSPLLLLELPRQEAANRA